MPQEDDDLPTVVSPQLKRRRRRLGLGIFLTLLYLCALSGMVGGAGVGGFNRGMAERPTPTSKVSVAGQYLVNQMQQCTDAVAVGNGLRAIPFCEEVLRLQPSNRGAQELMATALAARPTIVPTAVPATPIPMPSGDKSNILRALQDAQSKRNVDDVISIAEQLRSTDKNYERETVEGAYYSALVMRGNQRINTSDIEAGLFDLELAATLRKLDDRTEGTRQLVSLYQDGLMFYGADWETTIARLRQVYAISPAYRDTGRLLLQAYVRSGDDAAARFDYCAAERKYSSAMQYFPSQDLDAKRGSAQINCIGLTTAPQFSSTLPITITSVYTRG